MPNEYIDETFTLSQSLGSGDLPIPLQKIRQ